MSGAIDTSRTGSLTQAYTPSIIHGPQSAAPAGSEDRICSDAQDTTAVKGWKQLKDSGTGALLPLWKMNGSPEAGYQYVLTDGLDQNGKVSNMRVKYDDNWYTYVIFPEGRTGHQYSLDLKDGNRLKAFNADTNRILPARKDGSYLILTLEDGSEYRIHSTYLKPEKTGMTEPPPAIDRDGVFKQYATLWDAAGIRPKTFDNGIRGDYIAQGPDNHYARRYVFPDGKKLIEDIYHDGKVYTYQQERLTDGRIRELFLKDMDMLQSSILDDSGYARISRQMSPWDAKTFIVNQGVFDRNPECRYVQFAPGHKGSQYSLLDAPAEGGGKKRFHIFSESPLDASAAGTLMNILSDIPDRIIRYALGEKTDSKLYVVDEVGKAQILGEVSITAGGHADSTINGEVIITRAKLDLPQNEKGAGWAVAHEMGHKADTLHSGISDKARDSQGSLLFGSGEFTCSRNNDLTYDQSDFVSSYATTSAAEDFAETYAFTSQLLIDYKEEHPGHDFLSLPNAHKQKIIEQKGCSKKLLKKILFVTTMLSNA